MKCKTDDSLIFKLYGECKSQRKIFIWTPPHLAQRADMQEVFWNGREFIPGKNDQPGDGKE